MRLLREGDTQRANEKDQLEALLDQWIFQHINCIVNTETEEFRIIESKRSEFLVGGLRDMSDRSGLEWRNKVTKEIVDLKFKALKCRKEEECKFIFDKIAFLQKLIEQEGGDREK
jgi:hypothetical protein